MGIENIMLAMDKTKKFKKTYAYGGKLKLYLNHLSKKSKETVVNTKKVKLGKLKFAERKEQEVALQNSNSSNMFSRSFPIQNFLFITLGLAGVFLFTFIMSYTYFQSKREGIYFSEVLKNNVIQSVQSINEVWIPNIPKFEDRYTSILIAGVDAREPVIENGAIKDRKGFSEVNTDTMMQIVYDHQNNNFFMISLPRDLGHEFEDECLMDFYDFHPRRSINHLYKFGYMGDCPGGGIEILKKYVADITGFPVDYYAIVHLESFLQVIDVVGDEGENGEKGLWIDVPEAVDSYYPNQWNGYNHVYIPSGFQFLTSQELLYYSRVRIGSDDYHRARRQQIVISALKNKMLSSDTFTDPAKVTQLLEKFNGKMVATQFTFDDIRAGVSMYENMKSARIYQIVLDNKLGGLNTLLMAPSYSKDGNHHIHGWYLIPTTWNNEAVEDKFQFIKNYIKDYVEHPEEHKNFSI